MEAIAPFEHLGHKKSAAVDSFAQRVAAVKTWMIAKSRSLLGTDEIQHRLNDQQTVLESMSRRLHAVERLAVQSQSPALRAGEPSLAPTPSIAKRGLFVVGCGRSGTSVVTQALNSSRDVLVLVEANLFLNYHESDFAAFFNGVHAAFKNPRTKGTYLPPGLGSGCGAFGLLERLGRQFRFVGGKVAFGPSEFWVPARTRFVDFQAEHFFESRHLLLVRAPIDTVLSLHRMFPEESLRSLAECWLRALETCVDLYRVCPNCRWLFFDDLNADLVSRAVADLEISLPIPPGLFTSELITTRIEGDLPPLLAPHVELLNACHDAYQRLKEGICSQRLVCQASDGGWRFFDDILDRCQQARLKLPASALSIVD